MQITSTYSNYFFKAYLLLRYAREPSFYCAEKARKIQRLRKLLNSHKHLIDSKPKGEWDQALPVDIMGVCEGL